MMQTGRQQKARQQETRKQTTFSKRMQKALLALLTLTTMGMGSAALAAQTEADTFGLGFILGDPTGLSGKMKMDQRHSVDAALAYSSGRRNGLQLHGDYLWDRARSWGTTEGPIDMYYGLGGRFISYTNSDHKDEMSIGPRGSIGVAFNVNNPDLELFGELAAILEIAPSVGVDIDAGIGARIRF
jgi:hypothetical protein